MGALWLGCASEPAKEPLTYSGPCAWSGWAGWPGLRQWTGVSRGPERGACGPPGARLAGARLTTRIIAA